jgi:fumarate hydratase class I
MRNLRANLLELIRRTSAELPEDVFRAVDAGAKAEEAGTTGGYAMDIITKNIDLARRKSQPLCQDTGSILFFVKAPAVSTKWLESAAGRRWQMPRPRTTVRIPSIR